MGTRPKYAIFINKYFQVGEDFSSLPEMIVIFSPKSRKNKNSSQGKNVPKQRGENQTQRKNSSFRSFDPRIELNRREALLRRIGTSKTQKVPTTQDFEAR